MDVQFLLEVHMCSMKYWYINNMGISMEVTYESVDESISTHSNKWRHCFGNHHFIYIFLHTGCRSKTLQIQLNPAYIERTTLPQTATQTHGVGTGDRAKWLKPTISLKWKTLVLNFLWVRGLSKVNDKRVSQAYSVVRVWLQMNFQIDNQ